MTTPTRPACLEFALDFLGDPEAAKLRSYIEALEARAALAQPEPASQALADLVWPDPTTITPCGMAINGRMYRLTPMDEPEAEGPTPQCVADGCLDEAARQEPGSPLQQLLLEAGWLLSLAHPTPQPIPVSERLPGPGDCDAEGCIWLWNGHWSRLKAEAASLESWAGAVWLPASALPIPQHPQPDPTA